MTVGTIISVWSEPRRASISCWYSDIFPRRATNSVSFFCHLQIYQRVSGSSCFLGRRQLTSLLTRLIFKLNLPGSFLSVWPSWCCALKKVNLTMCCPVVINKTQSVGYASGGGTQPCVYIRKYQLPKFYSALNIRKSLLSGWPCDFKIFKTLYGKFFTHWNFHTQQWTMKKRSLTATVQQPWF